MRWPPPRQWHLYAPGAETLPQATTGIDAVGAWEALGHRGSPDVVVGLVDDSCWSDVPGLPPEALAGAVVAEPTGLRHTDDARGLGAELAPPRRTHGTSMATLIAARGPETFGVAPGCSLLPVILPRGDRGARLSEATLVAVLDHLDPRVDVLVLPFGRIPTLFYSNAVLDRLRRWGEAGGRDGRGVVVVAAAGNANCPLDHSGPHPVVYAVDPATGRSLTSNTFRNVLVGVPVVLHVGAVTARGKRAPYSGYGPGLDLVAPSSDGLPFAPETTRVGLTTTYGPPARTTHAFKGTSGSAALVAGAAALVRSATPRLTALEVGRILCASASRELDPAPARPPGAPRWLQDPVAPHGDGRFDASGWSPWFGHGRVDARAAVCLASRGASPPR